MLPVRVDIRILEGPSHRTQNRGIACGWRRRLSNRGEVGFNHLRYGDTSQLNSRLDGDLILVRELDERLGAGDLIAQHLTDLLRQSIDSQVAGHEDVNDTEPLSQDPAFRLIDSENIRERDGTAEGERVHILLVRDSKMEILAGMSRTRRPCPLPNPERWAAGDGR